MPYIEQVRRRAPIDPYNVPVRLTPAIVFVGVSPPPGLQLLAHPPRINQPLRSYLAVFRQPHPALFTDVAPPPPLLTLHNLMLTGIGR